MPGRHEFPQSTPIGHIARCRWCARTEEWLNNQRAGGPDSNDPLPPCPDAPVENVPPAGKDYLSPIIFLHCFLMLFSHVSSSLTILFPRSISIIFF